MNTLIRDARRFDRTVVLVTGASRGIGRVIARAFASEGAIVALLSQNQPGVEAVSDEISSSGGQALPLVGDVSQLADVQRVVAQVEKTLGPIHILINNAGIPGPTVPVAQMEPSAWERVLAVNLTGPFLCAREVLRAMIARRNASQRAPETTECILNIGSIAGKISYPQRAPYAAAKWGLIGLTVTLAEEVGPFGIRVNCVCPGPVEGELINEVMTARARAMNLPLEKVRERFVGLTMLKRMVRPEDVAATVLFLASEAAASITGQAIDVTGGLAQIPG